MLTNKSTLVYVIFLDRSDNHILPKIETSALLQPFLYKPRFVHDQCNSVIVFLETFDQITCAVKGSVSSRDDFCFWHSFKEGLKWNRTVYFIPPYVPSIG